VGGFLIYLAFRDLDWSGLAAALRGADYFWLLPYFGTLAVVQVVRAFRWRFLLEPIAPKTPSNWRVLSVSWVGFMAIIALPLRLGEVVRPYLISDPKRKGANRKRGEKQGARLRMSAALGTIAVERVVDGLIVSVFLFVTFFVLQAQGRGTSWMMAMGWTALTVFGGAMVFLSLALWKPELAVSLALKLSLLDFAAKRFGGRAAWLRDKVAYGLDGIIQGFMTLKSPGLLFKYTATSLVYWVFNGLGFWVLSKAFHLGLDLTGGYAICGLVVIGITLPTGPGLVGNFHEFARLGLGLYLPQAVIRGQGMAYVVAAHLLQLIWYVGVGALMLVTGQVAFRKVVEATREQMDAALNEREHKKST